MFTVAPVVSIYPPTHPSFCPLPIHPSVPPSLHPSVCPSISVHPSMHPSTLTHLSIPSLHLSIYPSIRLSGPSIHPCICPSVHPPTHPTQISLIQKTLILSLNPFVSESLEEEPNQAFNPHENLGRYFEYWTGTKYLPNHFLRQEYPEDIDTDEQMKN